MGHPGGRVVWLAVISLVLTVHPGGTLGCSCIAEHLCPAPDVDLRLVGSEEDTCPPGTVCCDAPVDGSPALADNSGVDGFCDGECVPADGQCESEEYDEYGTGVIDIRLTSDDGCPAGYICRKVAVPEPVPVCSGTCVPKTSCTMFEPGKPENDGCTGGNVCCRMDRESWIGLINNINGMERGPDSSGEPPGDRCAWRSDANGAGTPPWLVSIWARVEILPGLTSDQFVCPGVLTGARYVLTLASCVKDMDVKDLFVNVGDYDLSSRSSLRMENIYSIQEKILHEDYNSTDPLHHNAALLPLAGNVRNGNCLPTLATAADDYRAHQQCLIVGWDRELLRSRMVGRPQRYETRVASFNEDLFCAPGTICLEPDAHHCDGSSLAGSPVFCGANAAMPERWALTGLLVGNCTGISVADLAAWLTHQQSPGFVQEQKPTVPSRQYLPTL